MKNCQHKTQYRKNNLTFSKRNPLRLLSISTKDWISSIQSFSSLSDRMKIRKDCNIQDPKSSLISGKLKEKSWFKNTKISWENFRTNLGKTAWEEPPRSAITHWCPPQRRMLSLAYKARRLKKRSIFIEEKQKNSKLEMKV